MLSSRVEAAIEASRAAIGTDNTNSWLPFTGRGDLEEAVSVCTDRCVRFAFSAEPVEGPAALGDRARAALAPVAR